MPSLNAGKDLDITGWESEHSCAQPVPSDLLMHVFISWGGHGAMVIKYQFPSIVAALSCFMAVVTQGKIIWVNFDETWHLVGWLLTGRSSFLKWPWWLSSGIYMLWAPWRQVYDVTWLHLMPDFHVLLPGFSAELHTTVPLCRTEDLSGVFNFLILISRKRTTNIYL